MYRSNKGQLGFTLIEVLIALAIMSAGFVSIFQLFNQADLNNSRVRTIYEDKLAQNTIFSELSLINPADKLSGQEQLGEILYRWQCRPISPLMPMRSESGTLDYIQLYNVVVSYQINTNQPVREFSFDKLGWERKTQ